MQSSNITDINGLQVRNIPLRALTGKRPLPVCETSSDI